MAHLLRIHAFGGVQGVAAAGTHAHGIAVDLVGHSDHLTDHIHLAGAGLRLHWTEQQQGELVTAQTEGVVPAADAALQPLGNALQQLVAHIMAVGIVDRLEAIQVHIEQCKGLAVLLQHCQHPVEVALVQQAGQAIGVGKALQQMLLAHILCDHHHAGQAVTLPRHGNDRHHEKRAFVAGSIFQLEGVVVRFDQPA